ncbi:hypothetical protein [uncultured Akkermansia sp.]|uniref:hypothetical protein n=1 Tax=uncultured Akkermansia sp. TaxID=512294 RepID=UPI00261D78C2|nr:hypothetical protein [uncultured Akkermansia sp.]
MTDIQLASARRDRAEKRAALYVANGENAPFAVEAQDNGQSSVIWRRLKTLGLYLIGGIALAALAFLLVVATVDFIIYPL